MKDDTVTAAGEFLAELAPHQYGWPESLRFTYDKTRELLNRGVPGCLVECGVGTGVHPAAMARACSDAGEQRTVHLFDSFEGVPNGGEHDTEWNEHWGDGSGRLERTGVAVCSLDQVERNLRRWGVLTASGYAHIENNDWVGGWTSYKGIGPFAFHVGWFQETVAKLTVPIGPIAFLRLDGDLYDSTLVCLQHLYPLVSPGGCVVVDDWNLDGCRKAVYDYFASVKTTAPFPAPITASGDVWWTKP